VYASLQRGFREGLLLDRPKVLEEALKFARDLIDYFQSSQIADFVNKFGERRMAALIGDLRTSVRDVFANVLVDPSQPLMDRLTIYNRAGEAERRMVYDLVRGPMEAEYSLDPISQMVPFASVLPEPPGMEEHRIAVAAEEARRREAEETSKRSKAESR
jgi:hypothetical protein